MSWNDQSSLPFWQYTCRRRDTWISQRLWDDSMFLPSQSRSTHLASFVLSLLSMPYINRRISAAEQWPLAFSWHCRTCFVNPAKYLHEAEGGNKKPTPVCNGKIVLRGDNTVDNVYAPAIHVVVWLQEYFVHLGHTEGAVLVVEVVKALVCRVIRQH
jgi:hypothetical protein